jgi:hypothetical protein
MANQRLDGRRPLEFAPLGMSIMADQVENRRNANAVAGPRAVGPATA